MQLESHDKQWDETVVQTIKTLKSIVNHGDKMYKNDAQKMYNQPPIKFL